MSGRRKLILARASPELPRPAMAIGEPRIVVDKLVTRLLAEIGEPRISAGKEATRPKKKEHQVAAVKPTLIAASAADKDSHSETNEACGEQQTTKKGKTRLRFQWTMKLKNDLLEMYTNVKGQTGYMKKLKELWDVKYPEHKQLAANTLSDNARRLTKLQTIPIENLQVITETVPKVQNVVEVEVVTEKLRPETKQLDTEKKLKGNIKEELKELVEKLRNIFNTRFQIVQEGSIERNLLPKTVLTKLEELAANTVLKKEIERIQSDMMKINTAIYAMATSVIEVRRQRKKPGKASKNGANKTVTKMQQQLKAMKKLTSKTASEIDRRKNGRKTSDKEKENIGLIKRKLNITRGDFSIEVLTEFKHQCLNNIKVAKERIRVKTVTIARRKNYTEFEKKGAAFYKNLTETNKYTGNPPNIEEFEDFWANIWETERKINRDANWMNEIKREINNEVKTSHPKPNCSVQKWKQVIIKKKNWSSPGIDGIQNYWIKKMTALWQAEVNEINKYLNSEKEIPEWLGRGRTVLYTKV